MAGMGYAGEMKSNYKGKKPYKFDPVSKKVRTFDESMGKPKFKFEQPEDDTLKMRPGKSSADYNKARQEVGGTDRKPTQLQRKSNVVESLPGNAGGAVNMPIKVAPADRKAAMGRMLGR